MKVLNHYEIVKRLSNNGLPAVTVNNLRAKKAWNAPIYNYYFKDEAARDVWIKNFVSNVTAHQKRIDDRKKERREFINPAKIGDVLESSWGYEQTNVDYYQVTKVMGKMVEIREIGARSVPGSTYSHGMADEVKPAQNHFIADAKKLIKKVMPAGKGEYAVSIASYANAYHISPEEKTYRSWYA
jgi:hypothetical protein